jgi:hypothetical protein
MTENTEYTAVKIPVVLAEKINSKLDEFGYRSLTEFVIDSARRRLDQLV